jgi:hypothetical protein
MVIMSHKLVCNVVIAYLCKRKKDMINSDRINDIQRKIKLAILQIEKEENIKISFGACRYSSDSYRTTMTINTIGKGVENEPGVTDTKNLSMCKRLGFTQNVIGMDFSGKNGIYKITEIKLANRKYPVIATNSEGKLYKFTTESIKSYLGGDKIINRNANLNSLV